MRLVVKTITTKKGKKILVFDLDGVMIKPCFDSDYMKLLDVCMSQNENRETDTNYESLEQ